MDHATFIANFEALKRKFPVLPNNESFNENCDYGDSVFESTNSYYIFNSVRVEDCSYIYDGADEKLDVDCTFNYQTENCLNTADSVESNNANFSEFIVRCYNVDFCDNCMDCHDCFGCSHLSNKSFCIFNIQHTEEEYLRKLPELKKKPASEINNEVQKLKSNFPRLHSDYNESNNSDYCDYSYFNNNCYYCFDCAHNTDCCYMETSYRNNDCFDSTYSVDCERSAEIVDSFKCYGSYHVDNSRRCYDSFYLYGCSDCNDCFGCVNLTHKKYCILNVQYTKEEYVQEVRALRDSIGLRYTPKTNG